MSVNLNTASITELKAYCNDNNISVFGDKRRKQAYFTAIELFKSQQYPNISYSNYTSEDEYISKHTRYVCALPCNDHDYNSEDIFCNIQDGDELTNKQVKNFWNNFNLKAWVHRFAIQYVDLFNHFLIDYIDKNSEKFSDFIVETNHPILKFYSTNLELSDSFRVFVTIDNQFRAFLIQYARLNFDSFIIFHSKEENRYDDIKNLFYTTSKEFLDRKDLDCNDLEKLLCFFLNSDYLKDIQEDIQEYLQGNSCIFSSSWHYY